MTLFSLSLRDMSFLNIEAFATLYVAASGHHFAENPGFIQVGSKFVREACIVFCVRVVVNGSGMQNVEFLFSFWRDSRRSNLKDQTT
jgi:hypothetical protein